eukprot:m.142174 g.142174  ORF g.142174 m.142174 type:complete len:57 (+) comp22903_c0_seq3:2149-2319(+)
MLFVKVRREKRVVSFRKNETELANKGVLDPNAITTHSLARLAHTGSTRTFPLSLSQ